MKYRTLILIIVVLGFSQVQSQSNFEINDFGTPPNLKWFGQYGGDSTDYVISMATDNDGNLYTYGYAGSEITYFGETLEEGIFLSKQNGAGEVLWLRQFVNTSIYNSALGSKLTVDPANSNVYITGDFMGEFIIPGEVTLSSAPDGSVFIIKYDLQGNYIWHIQEDFFLFDLVIDSDYGGIVILSGTFSGTINISGNELTAEMADAFLVKYNSEGFYDWHKQIGGSDTEWSILTSSDADNNIYLSIETNSVEVSIGDVEFIMNEGDGEILCLKFDSDGTLIWNKVFGSGSNFPNNYAFPTGIMTDANGNTILKGFYSDSVFFDNFILTSPFAWNKFITRINSDGDIMWINSIKEKDFGFDYNIFSMDNEGSIYYGLDVRDTIYFEDDYMHIPGSTNDNIIAKYTVDGDLEWVKAISGNDDDEDFNSRLNSVVAVDDKSLYLGINHTGSLTIEDEEFLSTTQNGFIALLGDDVVGIKEVYNRKKNQLKLYPNPVNDELTIETEGLAKDDYLLKIIDLSGKVVLEKTIHLDNAKNIFEIDMSGLAPSAYTLRIHNNNEVLVKRLIKN
jgi:hypothetical protein